MQRILYVFFSALGVEGLIRGDISALVYFAPLLLLSIIDFGFYLYILFNPNYYKKWGGNYDKNNKRA